MKNIREKIQMTYAGWMKKPAPQKPDDLIKVQIELDEYQVRVILEMLNIEITRCEKYARLSMTGDGRSTSYERRDAWTSRAETCNEILLEMYDKFPGEI